MSKAFTVTTTIERPIDEVWGFLSDPSKMHLWMAGIDEVRYTSSGKLAEGSKLAVSARGRELETTVVAFDPPKSLALATEQRDLTTVYTYSCQAEGEHTYITLNAECFTERLIWKLLNPLIGLLLKQADKGHLIALKKAIEEKTAP